MNPDSPNGKKLDFGRLLRLTNVRILFQVLFFLLFLFSIWATWTSRIEGYPVSRLLEINPLVSVATLLSSGYLYKFLGWGLGLIIITFIFGRVFCNWACPFGSLHQFVGWLFNSHSANKQIESNRYHPTQYLKYGLLIVFLIMASLGALQIGLLDPIVIMYRAFTTFFAPASDMLVDSIANAGAIDAGWVDRFKFAPGVESRIFVGSFWVGFFFLLFVVLNFWKPRFFCRFLCPVGCVSWQHFHLFVVSH